MREILEQVVSHLTSMWRFRWSGLALAWTLSIAGCAWILMMPNIYKANTIIYVDTDSSLGTLLRGLAVSSDPYSELGVITEALLSRPQLTEVARAAGLDARIDSAAGFEALIAEMRVRIGISTLRGRRNLFEISYTDPDRETARVVVFELLNAFMSSSLGSNTEDSGSVQRFLDAQIEEHEQQLAAAEERLAKFKQENLGQMPGDTGGYYDRLETEIREEAAIRARLAVIIDGRDELVRQLAGEEPSVGIGTGRGVTAQTQLDGRIFQLNSQMDELLLRYTANHPNIVSIQQTLEVLEQQRAEERELLAGLDIAGGSAAASSNPVYQDLLINKNKAEVDVAQLKANLRIQQNTVQNLKNLVDTLPEIETRLVQLNRDYDVTRQRYTELLNRRESAELTRDISVSEMSSKFRILEPTKALIDPIGPNRPLMMIALLLGSLGAGLGLAFFRSQIKPVCSSISFLQRLTGRPVLGPVTSLISRTEARQIHIRQFVYFACAGLLLATYAVTMLFERSVSTGLHGVLAGTSNLFGSI